MPNGEREREHVPPPLPRYPRSLRQSVNTTARGRGLAGFSSFITRAAEDAVAVRGPEPPAFPAVVRILPPHSGECARKPAERTGADPNTGSGKVQGF